MKRIITMDPAVKPRGDIGLVLLANPFTLSSRMPNRLPQAIGEEVRDLSLPLLLQMCCRHRGDRAHVDDIIGTRVKLAHIGGAINAEQNGTNGLTAC